MRRSEQILKAFRIATILSGADKKVFCEYFKRELGLIVSQRDQEVSPLRGTCGNGNSTM